MYSLYCITFPNNKMYIGITSNFKKRMDDHRLMRGNKNKTKLNCAVQKYGFSLDWVKIIEQNLTKEDACIKEIQYIKQYDAINSGYNICLGGQTSPTSNPDVAKKMKETKNTPEFKAHMSKKMTEVLKDTRLRKKMSETSKKTWENNREYILACRDSSELNKKRLEKISEINKKAWENNPLRRKNTSDRMKKIKAGVFPESLLSKESIEKRNATKRTKEWSDKQSNKLKEYYTKGNKPSNSIKVICNETGEIFLSGEDCCKKMPISKPTLHKFLKNKRTAPLNGYTYSIYNNENN